MSRNENDLFLVYQLCLIIFIHLLIISLKLKKQNNPKFFFFAFSLKIQPPSLSSVAATTVDHLRSSPFPSFFSSFYFSPLFSPFSFFLILFLYSLFKFFQIQDFLHWVWCYCFFFLSCESFLTTLMAVIMYGPVTVRSVTGDRSGPITEK